jgi:hypothetical protein
MRLAHQLPPHVHLRVECARTGGWTAVLLSDGRVTAPMAQRPAAPCPTC